MHCRPFCRLAVGWWDFLVKRVESPTSMSTKPWANSDALNSDSLAVFCWGRPTVCVEKVPAHGPLGYVRVPSISHYIRTWSGLWTQASIC